MRNFGDALWRQFAQQHGRTCGLQALTVTLENGPSGLARRQRCARCHAWIVVSDKDPNRYQTSPGAIAVDAPWAGKGKDLRGRPLPKPTGWDGVVPRR